MPLLTTLYIFVNKFWWNWWNYWIKNSIKIPKMTPKRTLRMGQVAPIILCTSIQASFLANLVNNQTLPKKWGREGIFTSIEEKLLVDWMLKMADLGYLVSIGELKAKVFELTQTRYMPYTNGIPRSSSLKWFYWPHPYLTLWSSQGLEMVWPCRMCPKNVSTFYKKLRLLYAKYTYALDLIQNCDESRVQVMCHGGGCMFPCWGVRNMHIMILNEWKWLLVLTCINAHGGYISNFYIFRGKQTLLECDVQSDKILAYMCRKNVTLTRIGYHFDLKVPLSSKWFVSFTKVSKLY